MIFPLLMCVPGITTYREKFHSGCFQKVCSMSAVTEHIHSCHISASLSSRRMKAYFSPKRSYGTKESTTQSSL
jgi:hypothetical protein